MPPRLIVYHANCVDGFTAAWIVHRALGGGDLLAAQYGDAPPDVRGREVWVVDFSYPRETLIAMHADAAKLTVLDHHKTAEAALDGLDFCTFEQEQSGASLAWKAMHPVDPLPEFVHYVRDRDLWLWSQPSSRQVNAWIRSWPLTLDDWDDIDEALTQSVERAISGGEAILRSQQRIIEAAVRSPNSVTLHGVDFQVVNCTTDGLFSEIAGRLAKLHGAGAVWFARQDARIQWELRADREPEIDVSEVAKAFGGGGHKAAAGFDVSIGEHIELMGWQASAWVDRR